MIKDNNKEYLRGALCYMAGPIDYSKDLGVGFRQLIMSKLQLHGVEIVFLDPTNKLPGLANDVGELQDTINALKSRKDIKGLQKLMKKIVRADLRSVDYADMVIAYIDTSVHMCGSYHLIISSLNQSKPTLIVVKGGIQNAPSWIYGIAQIENLFGSVLLLVKRLEDINHNGTEDPSWVMIRELIFKKHKFVYEQKVEQSQQLKESN